MPDIKKPIEIIVQNPVDPNLKIAIDHLRDLGFEPEIQSHKNYLQHLTDVLPVAVFYTGPTGLVEHVNSLCEQISGYSLKECIDKPWESIIRPTNLSSLEKYKQNPSEHPHVFSSTANIVNKEGVIIPVILTLVLHMSETVQGELLGYWGVFFDTTQKDLRNTDPLTNLMNRIALLDELKRCMIRAERNQHKIFLLRIDIDSFSRINEIYGTNAGDEYLKKVTLRLLQTVREHDCVARIGGDEFGVLLADIEGIDFINTMIIRLQALFENPISIDKFAISSSACIGVSIYPDIAHSPNEIIRGAHRALVKAKMIGSGQVQFDDQETTLRMKRASIILQEHERALERNEIQQVYQPQVNVQTGKFLGYEALLRWEHPALGPISPAEFIPIAEQMGIIRTIDQWSQETAIKQHAIWTRKYPECMSGIKLSVNISARRLIDISLVEWFLDLLEKNSIKADQIILELTETALIEQLNSKLKTLHVLREYGFGIALDDFGTGYSSLSIIENIPFNQIKIDKSFIKSMFENPKSEAIVKSLIHFAVLIGGSVIAEGVETEKEVNWLRENGCEGVQGFYFSRPLLPEDMEEYIRRSV